MKNHPYIVKMLSLLRMPADVLYQRVATKIWTWIFYIKCRLLRVDAGRDLEVFGNCIIRKHPQSRVEIGNGAQLLSSSWRSSTANCFNCKLRTFSSTSTIVFGERSCMTGSVIIARSKTIRIGAKCLIAPGVTILDSDFHISWPPEKRNSWDTNLDRGVTLEDNVWIGMGCIVLKGVTIGENSVIAAGSVVVNSIPANCLAGGNPAKILKRMDDVIR